MGYASHWQNTRIKWINTELEELADSLTKKGVKQNTFKWAYENRKGTIAILKKNGIHKFKEKPSVLGFITRIMLYLGL